MEIISVHGTLKNKSFKPMLSRFYTVEEAQAFCDKFNTLTEEEKENLTEFEGVKIRAPFVKVNVRTSSGGCI